MQNGVDQLFDYPYSVSWKSQASVAKLNKWRSGILRKLGKVSKKARDEESEDESAEDELPGQEDELVKLGANEEGLDVVMSDASGQADAEGKETGKGDGDVGTYHDTHPSKVSAPF